METLGERIKRLREAKGMTQDQLAKAAGCAQSTIGTLEKDGRTTRPDLIMIAHALGVDAYYLKTGVDSIIGGDKTINDVVALMKLMSSEGRAITVYKAREIAAEYPMKQANAS